MTLEEYKLLVAADAALASPVEVAVPVVPATFLSANEKSLLQHLSAGLSSRHICCQVQLIRLVELDDTQLSPQLLQNYEYLVGNHKAPRWFFFNLISLLSLDFVFLNSQGNPTCVVELDGPEHQEDLNLIERDKMKSQVLSAIGMPFQRFKNSDIGNASKVSALVGWIMSHP
ncbi:DUF2726 domain-containing protein [Luteimonas sp. A501]